MTDKKRLESEVHNERINDLIQKFTNDAIEGGYSHNEILQVLCHQIVTYVTELEDPPRVLCFFMSRLTNEFETIMTGIENGDFDYNPEED